MQTGAALKRKTKRFTGKEMPGGEKGVRERNFPGTLFPVAPSRNSAPLDRGREDKQKNLPPEKKLPTRPGRKIRNKAKRKKAVRVALSLVESWRG